MDAKTRRFVEAVLVAAEDYSPEALDRAYQREMAEASKHREQERRHREAAEAAEVQARRLAGIRQLKSADVSDPGVPADHGERETPAAGRGSQERASQAEVVRGAIGARAEGEKVSPKEVFDFLASQGASVELSNVQLEMGRLVKKGKLIHLSRGEYMIPEGRFIKER
jgi:hypothetical protein